MGLVLSERDMAGADVVTTLRTSVAPASWILTLWLSGKRSGWTRNLVLSRIDFEPVQFTHREESQERVNEHPPECSYTR